MILNKINGPSDLKTLNISELQELAQEIREVLIKKISVTGGHLGGNLGLVECTVALHYVFNSPIDKFVFDVSHQCYTHKILTGRKEYYTDPDKFALISGYTSPSESEHDQFTVGHTSTSVSLASGLALARDINGEHFNVVAVIGDGSLSGGEALEGLDFAGEYCGNLIIVVNDNGMSIAENHGGIYKNLKLLRETKGCTEQNLFKAMGLKYLFVEQGNDINSLIDAFNQVKDSTGPIVVHICTNKGKGYRFAENDKEQWHWHAPFCIETGESDFSNSCDYVSFTRDLLLDRIYKNPKISLICAGTPGAIGFTPEYRKKIQNRFFDVGIAEEHAVAMLSAMAKGGSKPILCIQSSFLQRCYDQLSQDLALNNSSAIILVYSSGLYLMRDATHLGIFDMSFTSNIPNLTCVAPTSTKELEIAIDKAMEQNCGPVLIRVPTVNFNNELNAKIDFCDKKYTVLNEGEEVAVIALGNQFAIGAKVVENLKKVNINATFINPVYYDFIDKSLLSSLVNGHKVFVVLEDGIKEGGFAHKISAYLSSTGVKILTYGYEKQFIDRFEISCVLNENRINATLITEDVLFALKN